MQPADLADDRAQALRLTPVSRETSDRLDRLVEVLLLWRERMNLVSLGSLPRLWTRHIADSLQLIPLAPDAKVWIDLGSGAGFPGLVIACALAESPGVTVHLVESSAKKATFLREATRVTGAPAVVHAVRIETLLTTWKEPVDIVTARALSPLKTLLDQSVSLLEAGAIGLFPKGQNVAAELTAASKYWNINVNLVPSRTDPLGRIVVVRGLERRVTRPHAHRHVKR